MPLFGLGTWLSEDGAEAKNAVAEALRLGYQMIDTATMYQNEASVGEAIQEYVAKPGGAISREDLFIVTKLQGADHGSSAARAAIDTSLEKLCMDYVDLWLIHNPSGGSVIETWKALLAARDEGKAKYVGVSNFGVEQLKGIKNAGLEMPQVNQIEYHFALQQKDTVDYCKQEGITLMGYCPLARRKLVGKTVLATIAQKLGITEAQLAIRWSAQTGVITIPKSTNKARIAENAKALETVIPEDDMKAIAALNELGFKASNSVNSMDLPWESVQ